MFIKLYNIHLETICDNLFHLFGKLTGSKENLDIVPIQLFLNSNVFEN